MESEQERIIDEVAASIANLEAAARAAIKACQDERDAATARAEKAEALYAKAWEECEDWRKECGVYYGCWHSRERDGDDYMDWPLESADAHDAARKEAGL